MAEAAEASWAAAEITEAVATKDSARIAQRLGGIIANDDRIRRSIDGALAESQDESAILAAVSRALRAAR